MVPVDGQPWTSDPWALTDKGDGRLYGRGTCDMKAFSAVALALVPEFLAAGLKAPIHLALSYDEEVGCIGVHGLVKRIGELGVKPRLAVIGEPTMMRVVDAHKSIRSYSVTVTGHEAHSSNVHKGVSAVMVAAELIGKLTQIAADPRAAGDATGRFTRPSRRSSPTRSAAGRRRTSWRARAALPTRSGTSGGGRRRGGGPLRRSCAGHRVLPRLHAIAPGADIEIRQRPCRRRSIPIPDRTPRAS